MFAGGVQSQLHGAPHSHAETGCLGDLDLHLGTPSTI
jgi:hypothetical protein